jgi:glutamyl-tRNA reductase
MSDKILRSKIKEMVEEEISKNKEITKEGIFDKIIDRIGRAQKRAADKSFQKSLEKIARTPDGKKKVDDFIRYSTHLDQVSADVEDLIAKYDL